MTGGGLVQLSGVEVLVRLATPFHRGTNPIVRTIAIVYPGAYMHGITPERVSGLWMRIFLFTATALPQMVFPFSR